MCRTLGVSSQANEELQRLSRTARPGLPPHSRQPARKYAAYGSKKIGGDPDLVLSPLDKLEEPASLVALRGAVDARMPRVDLPELVLEIHARTGFADAFSHASEAKARAQDIADERLRRSRFRGLQYRA